jgi:hypothetical protein
VPAKKSVPDYFLWERNYNYNLFFQ